MTYRLITLVIVGRLALAPVASANEPAAPPRPVSEAAAREAVRAAHAAERGPMPRGLMWTGIGLIIGSGMPVAGAKLSDCFASERSCRRGRHVMYGLGGAMAGTGVALLLVGDHKRPTLPSLKFDPERITISQRITF